MITLENRFFPLRCAACFLFEGGIILFSVLASFLILENRGEMGEILLNDAMARGVLVAVICQTCMYFLDLYDLKHSQSWGEVFFSVLIAVGFVCIGIGGLSYLFPEFAVDGKMYYLTVVLVAILLLFWRILFDIYLTHVAPRQNILIVGTGHVAATIASEIRSRERLGFKLVGFAGREDTSELPPGSEILGPNANIAEIVERKKVDRIVVATSDRRGEYPVKELLALRVNGHRIREWPEFFEKLSGRILIDGLSPSYFIFNDGFRKSPALLFVRHLVSTLVAAVLLLLASPLILIVSAAIRLDSPGPVFYTQERVGKKGRIFRIIKFRSMRQDAEASGSPQWAQKNDPRVTRLGRILRLSRIDEIPQLFNVLRGDIDLVGPRPERPAFVAELERQIPYYSLRHTVKPGLTGWAQVMFTYCGTIEESKEKLQYDLFYIKNMSIKLDLLVLFKTVKIVLLGRGAR